MDLEEASLLVQRHGWQVWGRGIMVPWAVANPQRKPVVERRGEAWSVVFVRDNAQPYDPPPDYGLAFDSLEDANVCRATILLHRATT